MRGENLTRYLEDGRLELSKTCAERRIKPFVMGRKNWLFANTPGGAQASIVIYSLIETAKENGLDPYRYLLWLLQNAPQLSEIDEAWAEKLLPAIPRKNAICHKNRRPPSQRAVAHRDGGLLYADRFYAYDGYL